MLPIMRHYCKIQYFETQTKGRAVQNVARSSVSNSRSCQFALCSSVMLQKDLESPLFPKCLWFFHSAEMMLVLQCFLFCLYLGRLLMGFGCVLILQQFLGTDPIAYKPRDSWGINQLRISCYTIIPLFPPVPRETSTGIFPFPGHPLKQL